MTTREELVQRADELLVAAFNATMDVLKNQDAPPTAKASAITSALKIHEVLVGDDLDDKDISEMTLDELDRKRRKLERELGESDETDE